MLYYFQSVSRMFGVGLYHASMFKKNVFPGRVARFICIGDCDIKLWLNIIILHLCR